MRTLTLLAAGAVAATLAAGVAQAKPVEISSGTPDDVVGFFGYDDTQTYGQVFTAPTTGVLNSFTLYLSEVFADGPLGGTLYGGVGKWNGTPDFTLGGGVETVLYTSDEVAANHIGAYTFSLNEEVVAGELYVAYLTVFGSNHAGQNSAMMPLVSAFGSPVGPLASDTNYFVYNSTGPTGPQWDYDTYYGSVQFEAIFNSVPEPATWALMIGGFGLAGAALRRRRALTLG